MDQSKGHLRSAAFCGAAAGCVSKTCVAPLTRLVALKQVQSMPGQLHSTPGSATKMAMEIFREEGCQAFWRGNCSTLVHRACTSGTTFFTIAACNRVLPKEKKSFSRSLLISSVGAFISILFAHPVDVVKTRLLTEYGNEASRYYRNTGNTLSKIFRDEGIRGWYRGLSMSLCSTVPTIALNFALFDVLRPVVCGPDPAPPTVLVAACGAMSAGGASATLFPLDLLKKQMQLVGQRGAKEVYGSWWEAVRTIYQKGGFFGFYRGMQLEMIKVAPGGAILFVTNDYLLSCLKSP